jgi:hypothetical protein
MPSKINDVRAWHRICLSFSLTYRYARVQMSVEGTRFTPTCLGKAKRDEQLRILVLKLCFGTDWAQSVHYLSILSLGK